MLKDVNGNPDVCRTVFEPITDDQKELVKSIKESTNYILTLLNPAYPVTSEDARLWALARTHYELAAMWAVKAATTARPVESTPA